MIQLSRLEGFYWVGREGGFAAAVRAMPHKISQPAVYQQVRKLELEMECKLFERVGHGQMQLTSQGQRLFDHVAPFYENLSSIVRAVQANEFGGRLRIVAANRLITTLMPNWLKRTQASMPSLQVELMSSNSPSYELIKSGDADIVIDHFDALEQPDFGQFKIGQATGFIAVSNMLAERMGQKLDLNQLQQEKFIGYHPTLSYAKRQRDAAHALGLDLKTNVYVESVDSILGLVGPILAIPWWLFRR